MRSQTLIAVLLCSFVLTGCSTPRKLASSTKDAAHIEENRTEKTAAEIRHTVDSTKSEGVEVTYTKVEFFPPGARLEQTTTTEPAPGAADKTDRAPKRPPHTQGGIKRIETYTVKHHTEAAGVTKVEEKTQTTKAEEVNTDTDTMMDITDKPAADPYRCRYIFGIMAILAIAFFFFRKSKIYAFFRKLF